MRIWGSWRWWVMGMVILLGIGRPGVVHGSDATEARADAPQGVELERYLEMGTASLPGYAFNRVDPFQTVTSTQAKHTQMLLLTDDWYGKAGLFWSRPGYDFHLDQNQTLSLWLHLGYRGATGTPGEGLALVLQNDARGTAAGPSGLSIPSETLGVWGVDQNTATAAAVAQTAIQNSWALVFDTHNNAGFPQNTHPGNNFDHQVRANAPVIRYPHIGTGAPGEPTTYVPQSVTKPHVPTAYSSAIDYSSLVQGDDANFLLAKTWYHLTLNWDATTHQMTYLFDDKDPDTGAALPGIKRSVTVDPQIFHSPTHQVRWGVTAMTGANNSGIREDHAVVVEQLPNLVQSTAAADLTDTTTGRTVAPGETVTGGDDVRLTYTTHYTHGSSDWTGLQASLRLPQGIDYDQASLTIDGKTTALSLSQLANGAVSYSLPNLNRNRSTVQIRLRGRVTNTDTTVAGTTSHFKGNEAVATASTPAFTVQRLVPKLWVKLTSPTAVLATGQRVTITGRVGATATQAGAVGLTVTPILNDDPGQLPVVTPTTTGQFTVSVPVTQLRGGLNRVTVVASDAAGDRSLAQTVTITAGKLSFGPVSTAAAFTPTTLTGSPQMVAPAGKWQLAIEDTRAVGSRWNLLAITTPFRSAQRSLAGQLVYQSPTATAVPLKATASNPIMTHKKATPEPDQVDVAASWNAQTGLFLKLYGTNLPGTYQGMLTWLLQDAPA
ncbi:hypothetical protein [Levilactobacillus zymae]|uniref:hypothetical protein n=1 Tax=Levilactobacillus zymae TaxID=267363 RepID=UPI0028B83993|nr:hypothetical protein [Levilactobacillus zymae]MDT6979960.1 hypothetical protein [Levilactobacillus zymae]